jgi:hypothetical protein
MGFSGFSLLQSCVNLAQHLERLLKNGGSKNFANIIFEYLRFLRLSSFDKISYQKNSMANWLICFNLSLIKLEKKVGNLYLYPRTKIGVEP